MKQKLLVSLLAAAGLFATAAQADDTGWMLRARAVNIQWSNGQGNGLSSAGLGQVSAQNFTIPEVDVSYFFTKNIAAELVLTYPQTVHLKAGTTQIGAVKALPPSLLLQYHFTNFGAFKPYVGAGINYTVFTDNMVSASAYQTDRSSVGAVAQIGADYALTKNWPLNADVKYVQMATRVHPTAGGDAGTLDLNPLLIGVGVGYKF